MCLVKKHWNYLSSMGKLGQRYISSSTTLLLVLSLCTTACIYEMMMMMILLFCNLANDTLDTIQEEKLYDFLKDLASSFSRIFNIFFLIHSLRSSHLNWKCVYMVESMYEHEQKRAISFCCVVYVLLLKSFFISLLMVNQLPKIVFEKIS